jgi:hypothetical protein
MAVWGAVGVWLWCGAAHAGPPFVTDDPEPVDLGHWEINYAVTDAWRSDVSSIAAPVVDINYGAAPEMQLHAQPRYAIERDGGTVRGFDDTEVGIKYRFVNIQQGGATYMMGIYPMYQAATGAARLPGRNQKGLFLPLWVQRDTGPWSAYGGAGYRVNHGMDARNSVFTGATLMYQATAALQVGAEVFNETPDAIDARRTGGVDFGGIAQLGGAFSLLFSLGTTLNGDYGTDRHFVYLGLRTAY